MREGRSRLLASRTPLPQHGSAEPAGNARNRTGTSRAVRCSEAEGEGLVNLDGVISHPVVSFCQPPGHKRRGEKESRHNNFGT